MFAPLKPRLASTPPFESHSNHLGSVFRFTFHSGFGRLAAAKLSLQEAKRSLTQARSSAQRLVTERTKANAQANEAKMRQAEKELREA
jgi:hypothetical protein